METWSKKYLNKKQTINKRETLSMVSTCFINYQNYQFNIKQSIVSVVIYIDGIQKLFGSININLCIGLNPKNYQQYGIKYIQQQLNGRAKSKIFLKLTSTYINQMIKNQDQLSIGSGIHSNNFNNNNNINNNINNINNNNNNTINTVTSSSNTNTYNTVDRRLIGIPSKDTYSVVSYGGAIRYSGRKDDIISLRRDDSAKKVEQQPPPSKDYSNFGYTPNTNYYNKVNNEYNLTRGASGVAGTNIQSVPSSVQSSASRNQRISQIQQNRPGTGDQNSRLLVAQQNKRSKLQAEITKNRVQNQQLKNKLTEYVRDNMKLKQEIKKNGQYHDNQIKKQNMQLKDKNYMYINQIKELKTKMEKCNAIQREYNILKNQRQNLLNQHRIHQQQANNTRMQMEQLKKTINKARENQTKLYTQIRQLKLLKFDNNQSKKIQYQNKIKQLNIQLQYYQINYKNISILLTEKQQKLKNNQIFIKDNKKKYQEMVDFKNYQIKQINSKYLQKCQQCGRYFKDIQNFKNQNNISKNKYIAQNQKYNNIIKQHNQKIVQLQHQKNTLNTQLKSELLLKSKDAQKLRQLQQSLAQAEHRSHLQHTQLKATILQLQAKNTQLSSILSQHTSSQSQLKSSHQQIQNLLKQNLQLQLQLKYKTQQILKYTLIEQDHNKLKCKFDIMQKNYQDIQLAMDRCLKQSKQKNKLYLIQNQKIKLLHQERNHHLKLQIQLKDNYQCIFNQMQNKDKELADFKKGISQMENKWKKCVEENKGLKEEISKNNTQKLTNELKALQLRNKQLQQRNAQKIKTIQNLHKNIASSTQQIKQLQSLSQQRYQQLLKKDNLISQLQSQYNQITNLKTSMNQDLTNSVNQKKTLIKKNQVLMEELFCYKKKFQEEKNKSVSNVYIKNTEEYVKIKNLENQIQKKQYIIRKMEKQMMNLENQNINLNIQVMKKLQNITEDSGSGK